jgi:hypothetical protein
MFLFWYWFPRVTRYYRYSFYNRGFLTFYNIPFDRKSSFGFGICNTILTFCRYSMTFFVYIYLLLRIIITSSIVFMLGRRSVVKDLNPGLDLNKRSSRKRKRNLEDEGLERETQRVNRGESTSDQEEAGPSNSEQVEAGPSNSEQVEAGPSSSEQVEASPANIGQGLTGPPNIGQGPAGPANIGQGLTGPPNIGQGPAGPANIGQGLTGPPNTGQGLAGPAGQGITGVAQAGVRLWDR